MCRPCCSVFTTVAVVAAASLVMSVAKVVVAAVEGVMVEVATVGEVVVMVTVWCDVVGVWQQWWW